MNFPKLNIMLIPFGKATGMLIEQTSQKYEEKKEDQNENAMSRVCICRFLLKKNHMLRMNHISAMLVTTLTRSKICKLNV